MRVVGFGLEGAAVQTQFVMGVQHAGRRHHEVGLNAQLPGATLTGEAVECRADVPALNRALAAAIAQGSLVVAVAPAESSLEEAFRTAVAR